jgi:hypothetical protein
VMGRRNLAGRSPGVVPLGEVAALLLLPGDWVRTDQQWRKVLHIGECALRTHQQPCTLLDVGLRDPVHAERGSQWWALSTPRLAS